MRSSVADDEGELPLTKPVFVIDGATFDDLDGFFDAIERTLLTAPWGRNLDAFNDVLRGGFGTPDGGFVLRWVHAERSRDVFGYAATARSFEEMLPRCHSANVDEVRANAEAAHRGEGETLFDTLVDIIRTHGAGGEEAEDGVELELG